ncbi:MAG: SH3 domain-containing protein [Christensenellales bacterium]
MKKRLTILMSGILLLLVFVSGCSVQEVSKLAALSGESSGVMKFDFKGQIFKADDNYLSNVTVSLSYPDQTMLTATTDATGSFAIDDLPVGQDISLIILDAAGKQIYSTLLSIWPGYDLAYHNTSTTISLDIADNTLSMFVVCKISKEGKLICSAITAQEAPKEERNTSASPSASPGQQDAQSQTMQVAGDNVKLRAEPSTDSQILATLTKNTVVVLTGETKEVNGYTWNKVTYTANSQNPITGYIRSDLLTQIAPAITQ